MNDKFVEYYNNWKKETQFAWDGHFENKWYKKIIDEIDIKTIFIEVYKCLSKRIDYIAQAAEDSYKKIYKKRLIELKKYEKENEYIPLEDYCQRIKEAIKKNFDKI